MKYIKLNSLFLLLILSIQVLPLQQIAAWLSSGQVTEEIAHAVDPVKAKPGMDEMDPVFGIYDLYDALYALRASSMMKHAGDEPLFIRHADDIISPPPNEGLFQL